jgi:hypothetical protein
VTGTALMLGTLICEPVVRLLYAAATGDLGQARETVRGYRLLWRWLALGTRPTVGAGLSPVPANPRP